MKVNLSSYKLDQTIKTFAEVLNGEYNSECSEIFTKIDNSIARGTIEGIRLNNGLSFYHFNCRFTEKLKIEFNTNGYQPLRFIYCLKGEFQHQIDDNISYKLTPMLGSIVANKKKNKEELIFMGGKSQRFYILEIDRKKFNKNIECEIGHLPEKLRPVFLDKEGELAFLHEADFCVDIAEVLEDIEVTPSGSLEKRALVESRALRLLGKQIQQYKADTNGESTLLRRDDIEKIVKAKDLLIKNLEDPPRIRELAKMAGVNQDKLKRGFKKIFRSTIGSYLRNKRMEKAKDLMMDGTLNVQQIAEAVGYTSKGHFSKRFKERFGILPKKYISSIKQEISTIKLKDQDGLSETGS